MKRKFNSSQLNIKQSYAPTTYAKPKEIGCFTYNEKRQLLLHQRSLQPFSAPTCPTDLNEGFKDFIKRDDTINERLDSLVKLIRDINAKAKFVTWRGIMTSFITTPYSTDAWEYRVMRVDDTIYICDMTTKENVTGQHLRFTFYGYKFESLCTNTPHVNNNEQFCSVWKTKLGKHEMILGGEVDCEKDGKYVELKTQVEIHHKGQEIGFFKKCFKTWAQSFLAGVELVIIGFRSKQGELLHVKEYPTNSFPRLVRPLKLWDPQVGLSFAESLLSFLDEEITENSTDHWYVLKRHTSHVELSGPEKGSFLD